jgi:type IV pilus assembly protein PilA
MLQKMRNRKGFTLVELMIVVAIIGILAAIAIPNFLQFRMKAKTSEAKSNLGAIRTTEVAYFAEWNFYVANQGQNPAGTLDGAKRTWSAASRFSILGFAPEGGVYYGYSLQGTDNFPIQTVGFTATAVGDLDADGTVASFRINHSGGEIDKTGGEF